MSLRSPDEPEMAPPPLFGLAPGGVYPAAAVTGGAVRFYRTVSPVPAARRPERFRLAGGLFSVALSLGSPPPAVNRHRIPVEPGLSSILLGLPPLRQRSSGRLARRHMGPHGLARQGAIASRIWRTKIGRTKIGRAKIGRARRWHRPRPAAG